MLLAVVIIVTAHIRECGCDTKLPERLSENPVHNVWTKIIQMSNSSEKSALRKLFKILF